MNGFSTGEEDSRGPDDQLCCLIDDGDRCTRQAGNASYSKRIQRTVTQRKLRLNIDNSVHHIYICEYHKNMIQSARTKRRRKDSEDGDSNETDQELPEVDFYQLHVNTLKRYKNYHKLNLRPGINKAQLVDSIVKHFKTMPVREKEVLTYFIYSVKMKRNKLDLKLNSNV